MANILVIDDEPFVRQTLFKFLTGAGHEVSLAGDGEEGLSMFNDAQFDVVLTDLGLPGLSGREVISAINERGQKTRVIVLTGWPEEIISQGLDPQQVQGVLSKPFEPDTLLSLMGTVVGQER